MTGESMNKICDDIRVHKGLTFLMKSAEGVYEIRDKDKEVKACEISSPRLSFHLKLQICSHAWEGLPLSRKITKLSVLLDSFQ